ncbi:hypothetical protein BDR05DRAFT_977325 [Suillus weaverae]|nr:hypothetical protein BDR05DRAFT_977325 [Suillus weaverae]
MSVANNVKTHTNYRYHSHSDMVQVMQHYAEKNNHLKLKGLNDACKVSHVFTHLDDYKSLIMALSDHDVPHLQYILTGYSGDDLNITTSAYRLGGCQLVYAFTHHTFMSIIPTIGPIAASQLDTNINALILTTLGSVVVPCHGHSLMMDKFALEECASHHCASNTVIGFCHSHSHLIDPTLHTYDSALHITEKQMSVMAVGAFGGDETFPIFSDSDTMVSIFTLTRDCWQVTGAKEHLGPIFSIATDGDLTHRAAGHHMFLKLYGTLSYMPGLNLATGDDKITLDFDYKHIFKHKSFFNYCT